MYKSKFLPALSAIIILIFVCSSGGCTKNPSPGPDLPPQSSTATTAPAAPSPTTSAADISSPDSPAGTNPGGSVSSGDDTTADPAGTGEAIINDIDLSFLTAQTEADNARVFYEIFVGSFSDSDGDGTGDLRGIINRMDYLNDGDPESGLSLGVEGIWLSPIFKSPSYHKYDTTDYYTIDPAFGTMDDLTELVRLCHERNVKIILDLVINHTGSNNKWFLDFCSARREGDTGSKYYDFYSTNDSIKLGSRTFSKINSTDSFYECNFSSNMPELNYDNEDVYNAVLDVARYYLEDIGVDGFRFDAAKYIYYGEETRNVEFWTRYMNDLRAINPDIYTVAEVWSADSLTSLYAPALNCFDFTTAQVDGMISSTTKHGDVNNYTGYIEKYLAGIASDRPDTMIVPFISNHDMDRAAGYMTYASGYAKVAANLYILGPGSPFIYYGEEIALKGSRGSEPTDANRRLAMLWGDGDTVKDPEGTTFERKKQTNGTVADMLDDDSSLYNYYKRLILIRKANPEIASGEYHALLLKGTKMGGFVSVTPSGTVAVFHNTTGGKLSFDLTDAVLSDGSPAGGIFDPAQAYITAAAGIGTADTKLEGTVLTLGEQSSVVLRSE